MDLVACNAGIGACRTGQQWELASTAMAGLVRRHVQPNAVTHNMLLSACEAAIQWEHALVAAKSLQPGGVELDAFACSSILAASRRCSQWQHAMQTLDVAWLSCLEPARLTDSLLEAISDWRFAVELLRAFRPE